MTTRIGGDITPPVRSNGQPSGTLPAGTTQTTLSLTTNENATCRMAMTAGVAYSAMPTMFSTTGGTSQSTPLSGLANGSSYTYYIRCQDTAGNANPDDFTIAFSVGSPPADFSISATPASQSVSPGGSTSYTVTATPANGFSGTITFGVTGVPAGATASFKPGSVASSGSSTLATTTSASTPAGSYPLTITGTSGTLTRTSQVTLVVNGTTGGVSVTSITPNTVNPGTVTNVTIRGSGFATGMTVVFENGSGPTPIAGNVTVVDATTITATVTVKAGGPARERFWDVRVSSAVLQRGFKVLP
jgi:hypothetical protein